MALQKVFVDLTKQPNGTYTPSISKTKTPIVAYVVDGIIDDYKGFSQISLSDFNDLNIVSDTYATGRTDSIASQPSPLLISIKNNKCILNIINYIGNNYIRTNPSDPQIGFGCLAYFAEITFTSSSTDANNIAVFSLGSEKVYIKPTSTSLSSYLNSISTLLTYGQSYESSAFSVTDPIVSKEITGRTSDGSFTPFIDISAKGIVRAIRYQHYENRTLESYSTPWFLNAPNIKINDANIQSTNITTSSGAYNFFKDVYTQGDGFIIYGADVISTDCLVNGFFVFNAPQYGITVPTIKDATKIARYITETVQTASTTNIDRLRIFSCSPRYFTETQGDNKYVKSNKKFILKTSLVNRSFYPQIIETEDGTNISDDIACCNINSMTVLNSFVQGTGNYGGGAAATPLLSTLKIPLRTYFKNPNAHIESFVGIDTKIVGQTSYLFEVFNSKIIFIYSVTSTFSTSTLTLNICIKRKGASVFDETSGVLGISAPITTGVSAAYIGCIELINGGKDLSAVPYSVYKNEPEMTLMANQFFTFPVNNKPVKIEPTEFNELKVAGKLNIPNPTNEIIESIGLYHSYEGIQVNSDGFYVVLSPKTPAPIPRK